VALDLTRRYTSAALASTCLQATVAWPRSRPPAGHHADQVQVHLQAGAQPQQGGAGPTGHSRMRAQAAADCPVPFRGAAGAPITKPCKGQYQVVRLHMFSLHC
jgi:hypothetical protein